MLYSVLLIVIVYLMYKIDLGPDIDAHSCYSSNSSIHPLSEESCINKKRL